MENNQQPCPCRNMSKRISHEEIERLQDEIDGAYSNQENILDKAEVLAIELKNFLGRIMLAIKRVEVANRKAIHEITGHAGSNGCLFQDVPYPTSVILQRLNSIHDAINFLEACYNNKDFPVGSNDFSDAIVSIVHGEAHVMLLSKKMQSIVEELKNMTMKTSDRLPALIEMLRKRQAEILETFVKERMASNGK